MPKLNSNIYGDDPTSAAESISSDALETSGTGWGAQNQADYWGPTKDPRGFAKGNTPEYEDYDVDIIRENAAPGGDVDEGGAEYPQTSRMPRHVRGPKTSTDSNETFPPPPARQTSTKAGKYPGYKG
jgi:hypothetical protein